MTSGCLPYSPAGWFGAAIPSVSNSTSGEGPPLPLQLFVLTHLSAHALHLKAPLRKQSCEEKSALMNGDDGTLCFTKCGQELVRVLLSPLVDALENNNTTEEGLKGARRVAGSAHGERNEAEGISQGWEHCGYSINV